MHEIAIAQGILEVVLDLADGREVRAVQVRAGELLAVTQESLQFCFELVAEDTPAAAAQLHVQLIAGNDLFIDAIEVPEGWAIRPCRPAAPLENPGASPAR